MFEDARSKNEADTVCACPPRAVQAEVIRRCAYSASEI